MQNLADPADRIEVAVPDADGSTDAEIELDYSTDLSADDAWFVVRTGPSNGQARRSYVGHGAEPLREIRGVDAATFIPQWSPGS